MQKVTPSATAWQSIVWVDWWIKGQSLASTLSAVPKSSESPILVQSNLYIMQSQTDSQRKYNCRIILTASIDTVEKKPDVFIQKNDPEIKNLIAV